MREPYRNVTNHSRAISSLKLSIHFELICEVDQIRTTRILCGDQTRMTILVVTDEGLQINQQRLAAHGDFKLAQQLQIMVIADHGHHSFDNRLGGGS
jgi:hypothetical protein